jgi:hypothetical protein
MNAALQPRIRIDDLPALETLSDEEKARLFGAGRVWLSVESLEDRRLMSAVPVYTPPPPMAHPVAVVQTHVQSPVHSTPTVAEHAAKSTIWTPPPPGSQIGTVYIQVPSAVHSPPTVAEHTAKAGPHNAPKPADHSNAHPANTPHGTTHTHSGSGHQTTPTGPGSGTKSGASSTQGSNPSTSNLQDGGTNSGDPGSPGGPGQEPSWLSAYSNSSSQVDPSSSGGSSLRLELALLQLERTVEFINLINSQLP